ncbi:MAG: apolipoprotein N-acyltransferase [Candidatus Omnitrophica bacterium]|nr:apolipoprotein N-acyltransferase [Candidatus Omnitrophota bacterium]MBU1933301.1 apolipoprotein N-acyltransferase [Candidatus Omnitrophota bacterium]
MLLAIFSAILLILAFPDFNLSYLAFVGFVPLFFAIQNKSPRKAFLISYISGFLFYLGVLYWLYHVTVIGLIILCLYLALYFGIFALFFNLYAKRCTLYAIFLIPLIWISLEWVKARLFTGFGWSLLGYSQYKNHLLIQVADFSGVYGVSFVIMTVNVAVYKFFRRSLRELVIAGLMLAMVFGYGMMRVNETKEGQDIRVSVIQGNIPQEVKWDPAAADDIIKKYINLTRLVAFQNPDLIIWPETSFPGFFMEDKEETNRVLKMVKEIMIPTLIGANTTRGLDTYNSAVLVSPRGEVEAEYNKIHLVPFGEYVPFSDNLPILHRLVLGELGEFTPGKEYKAFSFQPSAFSRNIKFGTLICFEDIFPSLAREFVRNGARFLVVITNDAWYGKSGAPYQHAACSVFRAIENRVPVVRCANTGYSCFIDSKGRIHDSVSEGNTHLFVTGYKTSRVSLN